MGHSTCHTFCCLVISPALAIRFGFGDNLLDSSTYESLVGLLLAQRKNEVYNDNHGLDTIFSGSFVGLSVGCN